MTIIRLDISLIYSLLTAKCIDLSLLIDYSANFKDVIQDCYCQFSLVDWHSRFFTWWVWGLTITICNKITVHMHSKSNLIIGIAGCYTCSLLIRRKGDTFIIKGPFTFWNSPIWDFGGKDVFWQLFLRGSGKMKPGLQISLQTLWNIIFFNTKSPGLKNRNWGLAFWGLSFQHKGFLGVLIIVPIEKSLFTSFFYLINNLCLNHSAIKVMRLNPPGNWVIFIFSGQKRCTAILALSEHLSLINEIA